MSTKSIVITRPSGQARQQLELLHKAIEQGGIRSSSVNIISLPLLTIVPKDSEQLADHIASVLKGADLAIFVSPNAVETVMRLLKRNWQDFSKKIIPVGVMGGSSRLALNNHGIGLEQISTPVLMPQDSGQWDSEGLWQELQKLGWDWTGKKLVIFKGDGGREWLADTMTKAGASVEAISTYSRIPLDPNNPMWQLIKEFDFSTSLWMLSSSEAVRHLGSIAKDQFTQGLKQATAVCPHNNIADAAKAIGFGEVLTTKPGDEAMIQAALTWLSV